MAKSIRIFENILRAISSSSFVTHSSHLLENSCCDQLAGVIGTDWGSCSGNSSRCIRVEQRL